MTTVLIIENDASLCESICKLLNANGFAVSRARHTEQETYEVEAESQDSGIKRIPPSRGFHGNLHDISLIDLLQLYHLSRKSLSIYVMGATEGIIHVQDGEIVHAVCGTLTGRSAIRALLEVKSGSIQTTALETFERSINDPFAILLLDTLRIIDETSSKDLDFSDNIPDLTDELDYYEEIDFFKIVQAISATG